MEYLVGYYGGGAYNFFTSRLPNSLYKGFAGVDQESREIPFMRKISGNVLPYEDQSKFYERRNEIAQLIAERDNSRGRERSEFVWEYRDKIRLQPIVKATEQRIEALRGQRDRIEAMDRAAAEKDQRLKEVELRMKHAVDRFNRRYNEAAY